MMSGGDVMSVGRGRLWGVLDLTGLGVPVEVPLEGRFPIGEGGGGDSSGVGS